MELVDHNNTLLRIHHLPYVPKKLWFAGTISGTVGIAILIWAAITLSIPLIVVGGLITLFGLWFLLTDERHVIWTFDRKKGTLHVRYDQRDRENTKEYVLHDIRDAVLLTRAAISREHGHTFRTEVALRFHSKEQDIVLPLPFDTFEWQQKQDLVNVINAWLFRPTEEFRHMVVHYQSPQPQRWSLRTLLARL